jgi:hypothetical protein
MIEPSPLPRSQPLLSRSGRFAVVVPVGPRPIDVWRATELIKSLTFWEPAVAWCVIVDDGQEPRGLSDLALFPPGCCPVTIMNPRKGRGIGWSGGLVTGMLAALSWIQANTDAEFVLKVDSDALVIGPFADKVRAYLARTPDAGIVGTVGLTCNAATRDKMDLLRECQLVRVHRLVPPAPLQAEGESEWLDVDGFLRVPIAKLRSFDRIRPFIKAALGHGYTTSEFCQGGAYAMARTTIDRMAEIGCFEAPEVWAELPFPEDMTMAMYVRAVGLKIYDYSQPGEPFGIQYRGLPYPPETLVAHDYRIIHSLRTDRTHTEQWIRAFFAERLAVHH